MTESDYTALYYAFDQDPVGWRYWVFEISRPEYEQPHIYSNPSCSTQAPYPPNYGHIRINGSC